MDNEIVPVQPVFLAPVASVADALRAYQVKKDLIDQIMKKDVDYGVIPGSSKPTLLKAGAEKATSFFGLAARFVDAEVVNDWTGENHGGEPFFYYRRTCNLWRGETLVASVDGSCNSWEKKYRYRSSERICPKCGKTTIIKGKAEYGGGFLCFAKKGGCGAKFAENDTAITSQEIGQIKNPDVAELVNTILKMADKRALVAATLIATGMSEYFTQDIDDFIQPGSDVIDGHFQEQTERGVKGESPIDKGIRLYTELASRASALGIQPEPLPESVTIDACRTAYAELLKFVTDAEQQAKAGE